MLENEMRPRLWDAVDIKTPYWLQDFEWKATLVIHAEKAIRAYKHMYLHTLHTSTYIHRSTSIVNSAIMTTPTNTQLRSLITASVKETSKHKNTAENLNTKCSCVSCCSLQRANWYIRVHMCKYEGGKKKQANKTKYLDDPKIEPAHFQLHCNLLYGLIS